MLPKKKNWYKLGMGPDFAQQVTESQQRLYRYIYSLTGNSASSWDILQETNIVLWRKQADFTPGTRFDSWSYTIARFQVLAFLRDRKREPLSILTPELLEAFAEDAETEAAHFEERLAALQHCKTKLPDKSQKLLTLYYEQGLSVKEVSATLEATATSIKQALFRIRRSLQECIEDSLDAKHP